MVKERHVESFVRSFLRSLCLVFTVILANGIVFIFFLMLRPDVDGFTCYAIFSTSFNVHIK